MRTSSQFKGTKGRKLLAAVSALSLALGGRVLSTQAAFAAPGDTKDGKVELVDGSYVDDAGNVTWRQGTTAEGLQVAKDGVSLWDPSTGIYWADAFENGYVDSGIDLTNAKNLLSGRAYEIRDTAATLDGIGLNDQAVPDGTKVYLQFKENGVTSPIYVTRTHNGGRGQAGSGVYAFDLRQGFTDGYGVTHKFNGSRSEKEAYRVWIDPYENPQTGNTVVPIRVVDGYLPGAFPPVGGGKRIGAVNFLNFNQQRVNIFMAERPGEYMKSKNVEFDPKGSADSPVVNPEVKTGIHGRVWIESGAGIDSANIGAPSYDKNDASAAGHYVWASTLTKDGAKAYEAQVNSLPEEQRAGAAKKFLEANPDAIAKTVYGEVGPEGWYTLRFGEDFNGDYVYMWVTEDKEGTKPVTGYNNWTTNQFRKFVNPASALQPHPQPPTVRAYNVNHALVPFNLLDIEIANFGVGGDADDLPPAQPGDEAKLRLVPGKDNLGPLPKRIEWRNGDEVLKTCDPINSAADVEACTFTVPADAADGTVYTAVLVVAGEDHSQDSFIVAKDTDDDGNWDPKDPANPGDGEDRCPVIPGPAENDGCPDWRDAETIPTKPVVIKPDTGGKDWPKDAKVELVTEGPGDAAIDPSTGEITVTPKPDSKPGDKIVVTVKDPSTGVTIDTVTVTIIADTDGDGVKDPKDPANPGDGEDRCPVIPGPAENDGCPDWRDAETIPTKPVVIKPDTGGKDWPKDAKVELVTEGPGAATIDPNTGEITVVPDVNQPGGGQIVVTIKDPTTGVIIDTVTVTVHPDEDGDGVTDDKDKCPGTPSGAKVDEDGCSVAPVIGGEDKITGEVDKQITIEIPIDNPGNHELIECSAEGLPEGLSIRLNDAKTACVISGTPTKSGSGKFDLIVTSKNEAGDIYKVVKEGIGYNIRARGSSMPVAGKDGIDGALAIAAVLSMAAAGFLVRRKKQD